MDETIRVGDLVMVVKPQPCCNGTTSNGTIATVIRIGKAGSCMGCGIYPPKGTDAAKLSNGKRIQISRLKKIPPLETLDQIIESTRTPA